MLEHHHAADHFDALGGGDVVALDADGRTGKAQGRLQFLQRQLVAVFVRFPLRFEHGERLCGVGRCQIQQLAGGAFVGHVEVDHIAALGAQPVLQHGGLGDLRRQQNLRRDGGRVGVELLQECRHDFVVVGARAPFHDEVFPSQQFAVADEEDFHASVALVPRQGDHILIECGGGDDLLPLGHLSQREQPIPHARGALEVQRLGRLADLAFQVTHHVFGPALHEFRQLRQHRQVFRAVHRADARSQAELEIEVQAGFGVRSRDFPVAGAVGEEPAQQVQRLAQRAGGGVRAEVAPAVLLHAARDEHFREILGGDFQVGIALVIFEAHVEARAVFLDQVGFEDQRFDF